MNCRWPGASGEDKAATGNNEADVAHVDGNTLIAFGLQRVCDKRPFERHPSTSTHLLDRLDFARWKRPDIVEQPTDQRRLAMIDVPHDDDASLLDPGILGFVVHVSVHM